MKLENELLEKFQVEELEKRYEMSYWTGDGTISPGTQTTPNQYDPLGGPNVTSYGFNLTYNFGG
jgi:hypothetical protein